MAKVLGVDEALAQVRQGRAPVVVCTGGYDDERFGWFLDPEQKVELWQPK